MTTTHSKLLGRLSRRAVSLLMTLCLMLSLIPAAHAGSLSPLKAEVMNASGRGGETVAVAVYMTPGVMTMVDDAFWSYSLNVNYDPAVLTLAGPVADKAESLHFNADTTVTGSVYVTANSFGQSGFIEEAQNVFTMQFTINPNAAPGTTNVTLSSGAYTLGVTPEPISELLAGAVTINNDAPTASGVSIAGTPTVGTALTGSYTYADTEGNSEGSSALKWYQASDAAGTDAAAIGGATAATLQLTADYLNKYIFFEVTPAANGGSSIGTPVRSVALGPVTPVAQTATVAIGSREGAPGTTVKVPVTLQAASVGVASFGLGIHYDHTSLELLSIAGPANDLHSNTIDNVNGYLQVAWADLSGGDHMLSAGTEMFTLSFKILQTAKEGVKPLTVTNVSDLHQFTMTDELAYEMSKTLTPGKVTVVYPKSGGGPIKEIITVDVKTPGSKGGNTVAKAEIERTAKPDGTKSDKVNLSTSQAKQAVDSVLAAKMNVANIVIPDAKDEVSEVNVTVPKESSKLITDAKVDIGLVTDNVKVTIPNVSLAGFEEDIYFHFIPLKSSDEKQKVNDRANKDQLVISATGDKGVAVVGRPMTIETNLQNRKVVLVMPLKGIQLSQEELANLGIYVEHSDGTKELLSGKLVAYGNEDGDLGLEFSVDKFSTFTLVQKQGAPETHSAYVNGYEDGTFRPENRITRAEMATILSRVVVKEANGADIAYTDVPSGHWAASSISLVTKMQLMSGYEDGTFAPDKPITRAEQASLIAKLIAEGQAGAGFTDIAGHWASEAILQAQGAGVIQGYGDGSFKPEQPITRAEAVAMINKLLGRRASGDAGRSPWKDVAATDWAYRDIVEASVEHTFTPNEDGSEQWLRQP